MKSFNYKSYKGFTLLEGIVILIVSGIVMTAAVNTYVSFVKRDREQKRILTVDRDLLSVQSSLKQDLTSLPGRGLATSYGLAFGIPTLPAAGSMPDSTNKNTPIQLGLITPYKINGQDAFTIAYADAKAPRMILAETSLPQSGNIGRAKIALPLSTAPQIIIKPNPRTGTSGGTSTGGTRTITNTSKGTDDSSISAIDKGGSSTPSPSPSPSPKSTDRPTPTPRATPVPPKVPYTETLHGLPWIASSDTIKVGDLMLIVTAPLALDSKTPTQQPAQTRSRLIKVLSVSGGITASNSSEKTPGGNTVGRQFVEITYDFCFNNDCEQQSGGLINPADAPSKFLMGSILVPLRVVSYYWKTDQMSSRIVRNTGGLILPSGDKSFTIQGGIESTIGESDGLKVSYSLKDGSTQPTPNSPLVPWLNDVTSVDVEISREVPAIQGKEAIGRKMKLTYPIIIRNLE